MAKIKQFHPNQGWPPPPPVTDGWPPKSPSRILLHQDYNSEQGIYTGHFHAGPGNGDGQASGTYYSLTSSTPFTGLG
jgi:hypothetical protein